MSTARVGILGATGYTALELLKILLRHPHVDVVLATSRKDHGTPLSDTHPALHGLTDLKLEPFLPAQASQTCDVVFSCLPHAASASSVRPLVDAGTRVVDFSADYRLNDIETYNQWYGGDHPDQDRVGSTVYGLPELFGDQLAEAALVANPGCYPTSAILPLAPLIRDGKIAADGIIVDAKSGVSGAGRTPKLATLFGECGESISAYSVNTHRHGPEIGQIITRFTGTPVDVIFTPHLVPMYRGILATIYAEPAAGVTASDVMDHWRTFYSGHPFIRVVEHLPSTKFTANTNYCDMTARDAGSRLILLCSVDNLMKGASGAAVQNLNQMMGWPPESGF